MPDDELKRRILARRAKFVAAAVAGMTAIGANGCGSAQACLFPAGNYDATAPDTGDPSFPDATGPAVDASARDDASDSSADAGAVDGDAALEGGG